LKPIPMSGIVAFLYRAQTNHPNYSRPPLERPLSPSYMQTFFTKLFAPYCVLDNPVIKPVIDVYHFRPEERFHQRVIMRFPLREEHYRETRKALFHIVGQNTEDIQGYEFFSK
jgi:hypothetical protein